MRFDGFSFGSVRIDGVVTTPNHDVVIDRGEVRKRKKKASKKFREGPRRVPDLDRMVYRDISLAILTTAAVIVSAVNLVLYGRRTWDARLRGQQRSSVRDY